MQSNSEVCADPRQVADSAPAHAWLVGLVQLPVPGVPPPFSLEHTVLPYDGGPDLERACGIKVTATRYLSPCVKPF
jgi:hypothetical protein